VVVAFIFALLFMLYIFGMPAIIIAWFLVEVGLVRLARQALKGLRSRSATVS
jgi:hypothetical protein